MSLPLERRRVQVSAGDLACVDMGEGPPVVLLHGFPTSSFLWRREAWLLAQRMRVLAPDLLGYGRSDKPAGGDLSERAQARYVRELLERLGVERAALIGHDIGGAIAQLLALDHGLDVQGLVLVDSAGFEAGPTELVRAIQATAPEDESAARVEEVLRDTLERGMSHQRRLDPGALAEYLEPWTEDPSSFFRAARGITGQGLAGREEELARLDAPTLIIWGEEDPFRPPALAERLGEAVPGSTVALLPGCSHLVTEDAPETVGPLIYGYLRLRYLHDEHHHSGTEPVTVTLERPSGWSG